MSLDIWLEQVQPTTVYESNYTHNVTAMARLAEVYWCLWHPENAGINKASDLIEPIRNGLQLMRTEPERFIALDHETGWGTYDTFVPWLEKTLDACIKFPDASVRVSR
jgi:hypothetical protein